MNFDPQTFLLNILVIVFAIGLHEYCHAKFADLAGDPTPRIMGRVTLNPLNHLDPIGTLLIILSSLAGFGIGWGRPVLVDPSRMRNPRWDHFISVIAGPISNLLQAAVYAIVLRMYALATGSPLLESGNLLSYFLFFGVVVNLSLFFFNLIPLGPLDGHWLVGAFLPERQRLKWYIFNRGVGGLIFIVLILIPRSSEFNLIGRVLQPLVMSTAEYFLGVRLGIG